MYIIKRFPRAKMAVGIQTTSDDDTQVIEVFEH